MAYPQRTKHCVSIVTCSSHASISQGRRALGNYIQSVNIFKMKQTALNDSCCHMQQSKYDFILFLACSSRTKCRTFEPALFMFLLGERYAVFLGPDLSSNVWTFKMLLNACKHSEQKTAQYNYLQFHPASLRRCQSSYTSNVFSRTCGESQSLMSLVHSSR